MIARFIAKEPLFIRKEDIGRNHSLRLPVQHQQNAPSRHNHAHLHRVLTEIKSHQNSCRRLGLFQTQNANKKRENHFNYSHATSLL